MPQYFGRQRSPIPAEARTIVGCARAGRLLVRAARRTDARVPHAGLRNQRDLTGRHSRRQHHRKLRDPEQRQYRRAPGTTLPPRAGRRSRSPRRTRATSPGTQLDTLRTELRVRRRRPARGRQLQGGRLCGGSRLSLRRGGGAGLGPLPLVYPDAATMFTIAHSTFGNIVVGNYDTQALTGHGLSTTSEAGHPRPTTTRLPASTTAYGVWGDKIVGGHLGLGGVLTEQGYIHDVRTGVGNAYNYPAPSRPISRASRARGAETSTIWSPSITRVTDRRPPSCTSMRTASSPGILFISGQRHHLGQLDPPGSSSVLGRGARRAKHIRRRVRRFRGEVELRRHLRRRRHVGRDERRGRPRRRLQSIRHERRCPEQFCRRGHLPDRRGAAWNFRASAS